MVKQIMELGEPGNAPLLVDTYLIAPRSPPGRDVWMYVDFDRFESHLEAIWGLILGYFVSLWGPGRLGANLCQH